MSGPHVLFRNVPTVFSPTRKEISAGGRAIAAALRGVCSRQALIATCWGAVMFLGVATEGAEPFAWQRDYAQVSESGVIVWRPEEFRFSQGRNVRYIDFEKGDDANDGTTPQLPWKHHPWDKNASKSAAGESEADT